MVLWKSDYIFIRTIDDNIADYIIAYRADLHCFSALNKINISGN